jgi:hypothetical protein
VRCVRGGEGAGRVGRGGAEGFRHRPRPKDRKAA